MVKVQAPAMSIAASGKLGGSIVFSSWKGRPYARALVTPHNPKTANQVGIRSMLRWLSQEWNDLGAVIWATWDDLAAATNISPFNAYIAYNVRRWRENRGPAQEYPAAETATVVTVTCVATGGARSCKIVVTPSAATLAWGIAIFRTSVTGVTKLFNELVKIVPTDGVNAVTHIDAPLVPGTYYYSAAFLNTTGILGAASAEDSEIVT